MVRRQLVGWICAVTALAASSLAISAPVGATVRQRQPQSSFEVWTVEEASLASPVLSPEAAEPGRVSKVGNERAIAFADEASRLLPAIQEELGSTFVSAAIDPVAGNRLVVVVTGKASGVVSKSLSSIDGKLGEVRIVEDRPSAAATEELRKAAVNLKELNGQVVTQVARDDATGQIVIGVDGDAAVAEEGLEQAGLAGAVVTQAEQQPTLDGAWPGAWGSNAARGSGWITGGKSIAGDAGSSVQLCSSAFPANRQGQRVLVTAGHCRDNFTGATWHLAHDYFATPGVLDADLNETIGAGFGSFLGFYSGTDIATIQTPPAQTQDCIFTAASGCRNISFRSTPIMQGQPITKSGSTTGETSGVIEFISVAVSYCSPGGSPCAVHSDAITTTAPAWSGDSGGVLWRSNSDGTVDPLGITSGGGQFKSGYTNYRNHCADLQIDNCPGPFQLPSLAWSSNASAIQSGTTTKVFWKGSDNNLWTRSATGTTWGSYAKLADGMQFQPASTKTADGSQWAFYLGLDNNIYGGKVVGGSWATFVQVVGDGSSSPPVVAAVGNTLHLFYRGQVGGDLWHKYSTNGTSWSIDQTAPAILAFPAVTVNSNNKLFVFWKGGDGNLWERDLTVASWSGAVKVGQGVHSAPTATSVGTAAHVFYTAVDGNLWHSYSGGGSWTGIEMLATALASMPSASSGGTSLFVHWRGTDGNLWGIRLNGVTWTMIPMGSAAVGTGPVTTTVGNASAATEVFWNGTDGNLWRRSMVSNAWAPGIELAAVA